MLRSLRIGCIVLLTIVVSMPASAIPNPEGLVVTDALGRKVSFARAPQRIAVSGKALFMVADAIYLFPEASTRIIAIGKTAQGKLSFIKSIDTRYGDKTILESQAGPEQIAAVRPDAVILKSSVAGTQGRSIEAMGLPVVYVDFETPDQYERDIMTFGQLFQNEARASQIVEMYKRRVDRLSKALSGVREDQKPRVLLLYYSERGGTVSFNIPPLEWMQTRMVRIGGGRPAWQNVQVGQGWTKVTVEQIATWDADQIYIVTYSTRASDAIVKLKTDPQWSHLRAVKQEQLYGFPGDYYSWDEPDPRWILGLTWIATKMQPALMKDIDIPKEIRAFYQDFYGLDEAAFKRIIEPNLTGILP